jgi:hypothetical protein
MAPVYSRHLDPIVEAAAKNFAKCSKDYGFRELSAEVTVLSFVATVVLMQNFYSVFTGTDLPFQSVESGAAKYAELWYRVLSTTVQTESCSSEVVFANI